MAQYDGFAEQYREMVKKGGPEASFRYMMTQLTGIDDLRGKTICDVGCGQGELSRRLAFAGARVTGVDLSADQLAIASRDIAGVRWVRDDAMTMGSLPDESFDYVVSSVMLMDVPDHRQVFRASHRLLKPNGTMIWVIMHPCFQSPYSHPLGDGSRKVLDYREQFWKSHGTGTIRSTLGAYHRSISAYINDFLNAGFSLVRTDELERLDHSVDVLPVHFAAIGRKIESVTRC